MKNKILFFTLCLLSTLFCGCSTMHTYSNITNPHQLSEGQAYQLRVQTGHEVMDRLVYEYAYQKFGQHLPIAEQPPFTGTIDIVFASQTRSAYVGSQTSHSVTTGYGYGWYTGRGYIGNYNAHTFGSGMVYGSQLTWQNSNIIVSIVKLDGKRLWSVDYDYRGGWEFSSFYIHTPQQAARLCIERIAEKMENGFKD